MNSNERFSFGLIFFRQTRRRLFLGFLCLLALNYSFNLSYGGEDSPPLSPITQHESQNISQDGRSTIELPDISSDEQKLSLLLEIKQKIPNLFTDAAKYDIDLFNLLDDEKALLNILREDPHLHYLDQFIHKKYHEIDIVPPKNGIPIGESSIKPEALQQWKDELQSTLESLRVESTSHGGATPLSLIPKQIKHDSDQILKNRSNNSQEPDGNTLIGKLVKDDRNFMSLYNLRIKQNGANTLEKRLVTAIEIYQNQDHHDPELISKLVKARDQEQITQNLKSLLYLQAVLDHQNKIHGENQTWENVSETLDHLTSHDLNFFHTRKNPFESVIKRFLTDHPEKFQTEISKGIQKNINSYATQLEHVQERATKPIYLSQQHPVIGIFRGCTGGDCSSQYSFPYPNDPNEKVFFIKEKGKKKVTDNEGRESEVEFEKVKGYVSATEVIANGKPSLYVITVSGNHVNAGDTELILRALDQKKEQLGVQQILLPEHENVDSLINFAAPKSVYKRYTAEQSPIPIHYKNDDIRRKIQNYESANGYNQGEYDHMDNNAHAVILNFSKNEHENMERLDIKVRELPHHPIQTKPLNEIPKSEILEFLVDLSHSGRWDLVNKLMSIHHVEHNVISHEFADLIDLINQGTHEGRVLNVNSFKAQVEEGVNKLGINPEFLAQRPHLIYPGILHCNDAFSPEHIEETSKFILKDIANEKWNDEKTKLISPHIKEIRNTEVARNWYQKQKQLLVSPIDHYEKIEVLSALTALPPHDAAIEREVLKILSHPTSTFKDDPLMQWAVHSLMVFHSPEESTHQGLKELILKNPNPEVRAHALDVLIESPAHQNFKNETIAHLLATEHHIEPINQVAKYVMNQMHDFEFLKGPFAEIGKHIDKLRHAPETQSWFMKQREILASGEDATHKITALRSLSVFPPKDAVIENEVIRTLSQADHSAVGNELMNWAAFALNSFNSTEESTHYALGSLILSHSDPEIRSHALTILMNSPANPNLIHKTLMKALDREDHEECLNKIAKYTIEHFDDHHFLHNNYNSIQLHINKLKNTAEAQLWFETQRRILNHSKSPTDQITAMFKLALMPPHDPRIEQKIIQILSHADSSHDGKELLISASFALKNFHSTHPSTHQALKDLVFNHSNPEVRSEALDILAESPIKKPFLHEILVQVLQNQTQEASMRVKAVDLLIRGEPRDIHSSQAIAQAIEKDTDPRVRFTALEELKKHWKQGSFVFDNRLQKALAVALTDAYPSVNSEAGNFLKSTQQKWPNAGLQYEILKAWARSSFQSKDEILKRIPLPHVWPFQKSQFLQLFRSVDTDEEFKRLLDEVNRYGKSKPGNLQNMQELLQAEIEYFHETTSQRRKWVLDTIHQSNLKNPLIFQHPNLSINAGNNECFPPKNATYQEIEQFLLSLKNENGSHLGENPNFNCAEITTRTKPEKNQPMSESDNHLPLPPKPKYQPPAPPTDGNAAKRPVSKSAK